MRGRHILIVGLVTLAAACGSGDDTTDTDSSGPEGAGPGSSRIADVVEFTPGALADGTLTVAGARVDYVTVTPAGFEPGDSAPVLLAFPPGGQSIDLTRSVAESTYVREATERGWVVVSPAAPDGGDPWFGESSGLVPPMLDWIDTWVSPEGGSVHVAGVSNGGLSAFAVASLVPDRVQSLLVFPGFPGDATARDALAELVDTPVRMFVGATDTAWVEPMRETADTLDGLGGDVALEIVPDEGHVIGVLGDGVRIFDELDAVRTR